MFIVVEEGVLNSFCANSKCLEFSNMEWKQKSCAFFRFPCSIKAKCNISCAYSTECCSANANKNSRNQMRNQQCKFIYIAEAKNKMFNFTVRVQCTCIACWFIAIGIRVNSIVVLRWYLRINTKIKVLIINQQNEQTFLWNLNQ